MESTKKFRVPSNSRGITCAFVAIILLSCNENRTISLCDSINTESLKWLQEYYTTNDRKTLDSAYYYTEKGIANCDAFHKTLVLRKLFILSEQKEFLKAVNYIQSFDDPLFSILPYYNKVLLFRFRAMNAKYNNTIDFDKNISHCNSILLEFVENHDFEMDSIIRLSNINDILGNPLSTALTQYYQYQYYLNRDYVLKELLDLKSDTAINQEFIQYLEFAMDDDILEFEGI